jgi:hypothetical protein
LALYRDDGRGVTSHCRVVRVDVNDDGEVKEKKQSREGGKDGRSKKTAPSGVYQCLMAIQYDGWASILAILAPSFLYNCPTQVIVLERDEDKSRRNE